MNNWTKTTELIPDGVQTLSKMPSRYVEGVYPKYIERGEGAYVWGDNGKKYIDYPCGLGAVLLGYGYPDITVAVAEQVRKGTVFSLPNYLETELAEKICELIPSAEIVRFLKTGSEACSAAVKIARAYTGRNLVLCCGYHGWHDFYAITTARNKGIPASKCSKQLKYNDKEEFRKCLSKGNVAAVIMEPYVLEEPRDGFLKHIRKLCTANGTVLIFDEVVTGFRTTGYSAQKMFGITPDLTCLGKAMANGLPISCVCGKKEIMQELQGDCFVSSTFGGELASIAAALATIKVLEGEEVITRIWDMGERFKNSFKGIATSLNLSDIDIIGYPPRTSFVFPTEAHRSLFWQECLKNGVLFGYAQFISFSHTQAVLDETMDAVRKSLYLVRKYWKNPEAALEGKPAEPTLREEQTK